MEKDLAESCDPREPQIKPGHAPHFRGRLLHTWGVHLCSQEKAESERPVSREGQGDDNIIKPIAEHIVYSLVPTESEKEEVRWEEPSKEVLDPERLPHQVVSRPFDKSLSTLQHSEKIGGHGEESVNDCNQAEGDVGKFILLHFY